MCMGREGSDVCGEGGREVMCVGVEERRCCVSGEGERKSYRGHILCVTIIVYVDVVFSLTHTRTHSPVSVRYRRSCNSHESISPTTWRGNL